MKISRIDFVLLIANYMCIVSADFTAQEDEMHTMESLIALKQKKLEISQLRRKAAPAETKHLENELSFVTDLIDLKQKKHNILAYAVKSPSVSYKNEVDCIDELIALKNSRYAFEKSLVSVEDEDFVVRSNLAENISFVNDMIALKTIKLSILSKQASGVSSSVRDEVSRDLTRLMDVKMKKHEVEVLLQSADTSAVDIASAHYERVILSDMSKLLERKISLSQIEISPYGASQKSESNNIQANEVELKEKAEASYPDPVEISIINEILGFMSTKLSKSHHLTRQSVKCNAASTIEGDQLDDSVDSVCSWGQDHAGLLYINDMIELKQLKLQCVQDMNANKEYKSDYQNEITCIDTIVTYRNRMYDLQLQLNKESDRSSPVSKAILAAIDDIKQLVDLQKRKLELEKTHRMLVRSGQESEVMEYKEELSSVNELISLVLDMQARKQLKSKNILSATPPNAGVPSNSKVTNQKLDTDNVVHESAKTIERSEVNNIPVNMVSNKRVANNEHENANMPSSGSEKVEKLGRVDSKKTSSSSYSAEEGVVMVMVMDNYLSPLIRISTNYPIVATQLLTLNPIQAKGKGRTPYPSYKHVVTVVSNIDTRGMLHIYNEFGVEIFAKHLDAKSENSDQSRVTAFDFEMESELGPVFLVAFADGTISLHQLEVTFVDKALKESHVAVGSAHSVISKIQVNQYSRFNVNSHHYEDLDPTIVVYGTSVNAYFRGASRGLGLYIGDSVSTVSTFSPNGTFVSRVHLLGITNSLDDAGYDDVKKYIYGDIVASMSRIGQLMVVPSGNALYLLHIARPHVAPRVCKGGIDDIAEAVVDINSPTILHARTVSGVLLTFNSRVPDGSDNFVCKLVRSRQLPGLVSPLTKSQSEVRGPRSQSLVSNRGYLLASNGCTLSVMDTVDILKNREGAVMLASQALSSCQEISNDAGGFDNALSQLTLDLSPNMLRHISDPIEIYFTASFNVVQLDHANSNENVSAEKGVVMVYQSLLVPPPNPENEYYTVDLTPKKKKNPLPHVTRSMNGKFDSGLNSKTSGGVNEMYNIEKELRNIRDSTSMLNRQLDGRSNYSDSSSTISRQARSAHSNNGSDNSLLKPTY